MNTEAKFWESVERIPEAGCWIWTGGEDGKGYGRYALNGKRHAAHRLAFSLSSQLSIEGKCVCHRCDVSLCINPEHLFLGTQQDNLADMRAKGRDAEPPLKRGTEHYEGKLSECDVRAIRTRYTGQRGQLLALAKEFHVTYGMIGHIVHGRKWTHLQ